MKFSEIDIFSLNPVDDISYIQEIKIRSSMFRIYWNHFKQIFRAFFTKDNLCSAKICFYGVTINNQRSFSPLIPHLKSSYVNISSDECFAISKYMFISLFYIVPLIREYKRSDSTRKRKIISQKTKYLFTYGKYIIAGNLLDKIQPKILILSNDHSCMNRCLLEQARSRGIKTLYVQHASVSSQFPRLSFNYSFLDSSMQFEMYGNTSVKDSVVFLSGPCRYDYMSTFCGKHGTYIGISINEFDDFDIVKDVCISLKDRGNDKIIVRPHPSMGDWHKEWFLNNRIEFSTPAVQSPAEYLSSLKVQIANVSGIHLDAIMLHIPTILFSFSKTKLQDIFGYISLGLVKEYYDIDTLSNAIINNDMLWPTEETVRKFISSYNTSIEFKVGEFIAHICDSIITDVNFDPVSFSIESGIKAYKF